MQAPSCITHVTYSLEPFPPRPGAELCRRQLRLIDPHRALWHTRCCDFRYLHFAYLLDGCLYDDDLPIANLEPGVSGRNSLPLPGTPGPVPLWASRLWVDIYPLGICLGPPPVRASRFASPLKRWSLHLGVIMEAFFRNFILPQMS